MNKINFKFPKNENEYLKLLDQIEKDLNSDTSEYINDILDKLFSIKPVHLKWFFLKHKALKMSGKNTDAIDNILMEKYCMSYESDNLIKLIDHFIKKSENDGDFLERDRLLYHKSLKKISDGITDTEDNNFLTVLFEKYGNSFSNFLDTEYEKKDISSIIDYFYICNDYFCYTVFSELYQKLYTDFQKKDLVNDNTGLDYLSEILNKNYTFVVIEQNSPSFLCKAVSKAINILGGNLFYLSDIQKIEIDNNVNPKDTVKISLDNSCIGKYNEKIIYPIELIVNGKSQGNNIPYLLEYINKNLTADGLSFVISNGTVMDNLSFNPVLQKNLQRLCSYQAKYFENNLTYGWCGDYLSYISVIYKMDAHKCLNIIPEYEYSIVIPVRNSTDTLKYTIQTCLEMDYDGSYEIVISDNSSPGNNTVKEFIDNLNDDRINYYRPCRELELPQNFEYAYLNAKGKFIFSIGADDAVLPWALNVLDDVRSKYPDEEVLLWQRGFYAWPGFNNGQQNQFVIPKTSHYDNINYNVIPNTEFINSTLNNHAIMYSMPLLYINSGFKREYMKTLLEKTGRMWDGCGQDIYIGIVNTFIYNHIVKIDYPLTIAGMSGKSIGFNSGKADIELYKSKSKKSSSFQVYCLSKAERTIPYIPGDVTALYYSLLRAYEIGIISQKDFYSFLNLKNIFSLQITSVSKKDIYFEERYKSCLYYNKDLKEWFENSFHEKAFFPVMYNDEQDQVSYNVGFQSNGALMLDASDFGVSDIYGATQLFKKFYKP